MRVLIVSNVFAPDRAGVAAIATDLATSWAEDGHDVTVRCAYPYYPEWADKSGLNGLEVRRTEELGLSVERFGIWIPARPGSLFGRLMQEVSFFASLTRSAKRCDFDAVVVFCPLIGAVLFALLLRRLHRVPVLVNVQDLPAEAAMTGGIAGKRIGRVLAWFQAVVLGRCDAITTISPVMQTKLAATLGDGRKVHVVPNWLGRSLEQAIQASVEARPASSPVRLLYAGTLGAKQDMVRAVTALSQVDLPFQFRLFGDGSEKGALLDRLSELGDPRFEAGDMLSVEDFIGQIREADWFVIPEVGGASAPFFPSKLVPVIATGCPVLAICEPGGPLWQEVTAWGVGRALRWDQLSNDLGTALEDPESFRSACRERAAYYSRHEAYRRIRALVVDSIARFGSRGGPSDPAVWETDRLDAAVGP